MSIHPITGREVQDVEDWEKHTEAPEIDFDTAECVRGAGIALLCLASAWLIMWLCAWASMAVVALVRS